MLLRSTPGSELLKSRGRCPSEAGKRGSSCNERPSPTSPAKYQSTRGVYSIGKERVR